MSAYLQFQSLSKCYGAVHALAEVNLTVARGEVLAVLGPNGAGKSTLFGCLLGFTRPTAGVILQSGAPISAGQRQNFGYLPERVALYPHCSVFENGMFFAHLKGQAPRELERQFKRVGLDHVRDRQACQLSKGMLQRLGLAIALCGEPELLILDEPFNGLDPVLLETLQEMLAEEHRRGATILLSTHTMSAVEPLATQVAVLLEGRLAAHGSIEQLRRWPGEAASLEAIYHRIAREQLPATVPETFA